MCCSKKGNCISDRCYIVAISLDKNFALQFFSTLRCGNRLAFSVIFWPLLQKTKTDKKFLAFSIEIEKSRWLVKIYSRLCGRDIEARGGHCKFADSKKLNFNKKIFLGQFEKIIKLVTTPFPAGRPSLSFWQYYFHPKNSIRLFISK